MLAIVATTVYLLTLEPTVSFWDCGEFISVSYLLQVGHPPGAPLYQLLAHAFTWLASGDPMLVARCCNALSAVAGGLTVMFLYWTILLTFPRNENPNENQNQNENENRASHSSPKLGRGMPVAFRAEPCGQEGRRSVSFNFQFSIFNFQFSISHLPALFASLCYLFCDTAWFSAVESEVYSLAMLVAAVIVWAALRWYHNPDGRWLLLIAFLAGLGACVHLLTLLTLPAVLLLVILKVVGIRKESATQNSKLTAHSYHFSFYLLVFSFFLLGLTPYLIIPIRAAAGTPINEGNPATAESFKAYLSRERYEHAPLYPRMWRHHKNDDIYAASWSGGDRGFWGNVKYYASYQLNYMYLRYLMWNFSGRYNDRQGYGSPQNGQFITGIPPLDRLLVGTGKRPPDSLPTAGHNRYFLLPLLLGVIGLVALFRKPKKESQLSTFNFQLSTFLLALFLMGGIVLNLYLNHPAYEPRERDYAYILSFYAFAIFIAHGARMVIAYWQKLIEKRNPSNSQFSIFNSQFSILLLAVPLLMAFQNWDDHDRSHRYVARDAAANILNSCSRDPKGSVLFTYGDNDTFPLWYLQTVEKERLDVRVENIGLLGWNNYTRLLQDCLDTGRPVYYTHYAQRQFQHYLPGHLLLEGNTFRLYRNPEPGARAQDSVDCEAFFLHLYDGMGWHSLDGVYIDETCCKFLEQYWKDILLLANNLTDRGEAKKALAALDKTLVEIPLTALQDPLLIEQIALAYRHAGDEEGARIVLSHLRTILSEQLDYYHSQSPARQANMPYTLTPREQLFQRI